MLETLEEFVDSRGHHIGVDREGGVIRGVKILGLRSRNGRVYLPEALTKAASLYEGAKVHVNHAKQGPVSARDYQDRIGAIRNVAARPDEGLFADFHFNPKHALAEQLLWDAEHAPENVGFSHNVEARTSRQGNATVVEAIVKVQSVDLVADPATTQGLFESRQGEDAPAAEALDETLAEDRLAAMTGEDVKRLRPDLVAVLVEEHVARISRLQAELDSMRAEDAARHKQTLARRLLREHALPDPDAADARARTLVSPRFFQSLLAAASEEEMRRLVEDRAAVARGSAIPGAGLTAKGCRPLSRDALEPAIGSSADVRCFVEAICGRRTM